MTTLPASRPSLACLLPGVALLLVPTLLARLAQAGSVDAGLLAESLGMALAYATLALLLQRYSVWSLTVAWLGLPLLQFSLFWLQWLPALLCTGLWGLALWQTARLEPAAPPRSAAPDWLALALLLGWVSLSGAGGYGLQKEDYVLHNSRLVDLIDYAWPVHFEGVGRWFYDPAFGPDYTLMVQYSAYYLPAAFIGKCFGYPAALEAQHLWTVIGAWLAWRWLLQLSGLAAGRLVALALVFYGGWDAFAEWDKFTSTLQAAIALPGWRALVQQAPLLEPNFLDFWPTGRLHTPYLFGHYVSSSAQLFWAPHQTLAAWLTAALLARAWLAQRDKVLCFCYALVALWSPMNLMALALLPLCFVWRRGLHSLQAALSWQNALAGGSLLLVLGLYYTSGSALTNPGTGFLWSYPGVQWTGLASFHLLAWGIYALGILLVGWQQFTPAWWQLFGVVCASLLLLPLYRYGEYSDLLVRGSASLTFLLLALLLHSVQLALQQGRRVVAVMLLCLLVPGAGSGTLSLASSALRYNERVPGLSVVWYGEGWLFMGRQSSLFGRWLAEKTGSE